MQLDPERLYKVEELAPMLRVSKETIRRWVRQGVLPATRPAGPRPGARMLILGRDVLALVDESGGSADSNGSTLATGAR